MPEGLAAKNSLDKRFDPLKLKSAPPIELRLPNASDHHAGTNTHPLDVRIN